MVLAEETELTESAVDDALGQQETGVLSLARGDEPYAIPISYGYDRESRTFYLRLVSTPESKKRAFLASSPSARLVVYDEQTDGGQERYRSIVATGNLESIEPSELTVEQIEQYGETRRPLFEIWGQSKADLDIQLYALRPETLSGRETVVKREE